MSLERIRNRFESYVKGGRTNHELVLSDEAESEAHELWLEAIEESPGKLPALPVLDALAWFHWARYCALPQGRDRDDLQASVALFAIHYMMDPGLVPDALHDILRKEDLGAVEDNVGISARDQGSYIGEQYPTLVAELLKIKASVTSIPMPSEDKPDINGFREGDRVRLIVDFDGEESHFKNGSTGTVIVSNTSPAHIEMARDIGLLEIMMDAGTLIGVRSHQVEKIPGRARVVYSEDGESVSLDILD